ncbi:hypothetical protein BH20ACT3_BH20ACT3_13620 [soil metagenome]
MKIFERLVGSRRQLSCKQVGRLLQTYLDDELDRDAARKVEDHLEDCIRCGLEVQAYEALRASLQRMPVGAIGDHAGSTDDPVARLRAFGERLAVRGPDPGNPWPTP